MGKVAKKLIHPRFKWARKTRNDELEEYLVASDIYEDLVRDHLIDPMCLFGFPVRCVGFLREGEYLLLPKPMADTLDVLSDWCSPGFARETALSMENFHWEEV